MQTQAVVEVQPIWVVVDVHEGSRVCVLLEELGASVETRHLSGGDYLLGAGAVVERKTVRDFHLTLIEGRLWAQIGLLRRYPRPYLLVEGPDLDDGPVSSNGILGALLAVMDQQVNVLRTGGLQDSAHWLYRLAHRRQRHRRRDKPRYAQRPPPTSKAEAAEAILAAVPGISVKTARALLQHFGSVRAVLAAKPEKWRAVRGVGAARADWLMETLDHDVTVDQQPP